MIRRVFIEEKASTNYAPFSFEDVQSAVKEGRDSERARILELVKDIQDDFVHDPAYGLALLVKYLEEGEGK